MRNQCTIKYSFILLPAQFKRGNNLLNMIYFSHSLFYLLLILNLIGHFNHTINNTSYQVIVIFYCLKFEKSNKLLYFENDSQLDLGTTVFMVLLDNFKNNFKNYTFNKQMY